MAAFPGWGRDDESRGLGERVFGEGARTWAQWATDSGRNAWLYRVDFAPSSRFGACHCIELPLVFDTWREWGPAPMLQGAKSADLQRLTSEFQTAWVSFIRNGDPGWEKYPGERHFK